MTLTKATDCSQINVNSTLYAEYTAAPGLYNSIEQTVEVNGVTVSFDELKFTLVPADFGLTDALSDGIYTVTFKLETLAGLIKTETGCILIDCELKCKILEKPDEYCTYFVLKESDSCNCKCEERLLIYEDLIDKLKKNCGC